MTIDNTVFESKRTLIPYFTYADPNPAFTEQLIRDSFENGADLIEIGIPFSESLADGPVIQESHHRALSNNKGNLLKDAMSMVYRIKQDIEKPIVLMLAYNMVHQFGIESFFKSASQKGVDGVIIPDLPFDGSKKIRNFAKGYGVDLIFLVTPQSDKARIEEISKASTGFLYVVSVTGITGVQKQLNKGVKEIVQIAKRVSDIPVSVGFGISTPEHVSTVCRFSDAAIVGSAFMRLIEENISDLKMASSKVLSLVRKLKKG